MLVNRFIRTSCATSHSGPPSRLAWRLRGAEWPQVPLARRRCTASPLRRCAHPLRDTRFAPAVVHLNASNAARWSRAASAAPSSGAAGAATLRGRVARIIFRSNDNGFSVLAVEPEDRAALPSGLPSTDTVVAVGAALGGYGRGDAVELQGGWAEHAKFGKQFKASRGVSFTPTSNDSLVAYLGSGSFRGIGPAIAQRVVDKFGADAVVEMLRSGDLAPLIQVKGISKRVLDNVRASWQENKGAKDLIMFLQAHDVSLGLATRLRKRYGESALATLKANPYRLVTDMQGVGFATADKIARKLGLTDQSEHRIQAAVLHALRAAAGDGHCCLTGRHLVARTVHVLSPRPQAASAAAAHLDDDPEGAPIGAAASSAEADHAALVCNVARQIAALAARGGVVRETEFTMDRPQLGATAGASAYELSPADAEAAGSEVVDAEYLLPAIQHAESTLAQALTVLKGCQSAASTVQVQGEQSGAGADLAWRRHLTEVLRANADGGGQDVQLTAEQVQAVEVAMEHPVSIITGGPGTGKTFATSTIVDVWRRLGLRVALACPTARAAHRLNDMMRDKSSPAVTLHRLLEYGPRVGGGGGGADEPASSDADGSGGSGSEGFGGARYNFRRNRRNPLEVDAVLVDEASMLDVFLASALFDSLAISGGRRVSVVLVGDVDQLPSVGPGRVLGDLLSSGWVPSTTLSVVFRQAAVSSIVRNAHLVNTGKMPKHLRALPHGVASQEWVTPAAEEQESRSPEAVAASIAFEHAASHDAAVMMALGAAGGSMHAQHVTAAQRPPVARPAEPRVQQPAARRMSVDAHEVELLDAGADCLFVNVPDAAAGVHAVVDDVLPYVQSCGFSVHDDMQVLAPMRRGPFGVEALNRRLQAVLNPASPARQGSWQNYSVGDRVMQLSNAYDRGVINGDIGEVVGVGADRLVVRFDADDLGLAPAADNAAALSVPITRGTDGDAFRDIPYTRSEAAKQLDHAYAVTVHKAQGSEWPVVVLALHQSHYVNLSRGLFYTALARAQRLCVIVGTKKAMAIAAKQTRDTERYTQLLPRLDLAMRSPTQFAAAIAAAAPASLPNSAPGASVDAASASSVAVDGGAGEGHSQTGVATQQERDAKTWESVGVGSVVGDVVWAPPRSFEREQQARRDRMSSTWDSFGLEDALMRITPNS